MKIFFEKYKDTFSGIGVILTGILLIFTVVTYFITYSKPNREQLNQVTVNFEKGAHTNDNKVNYDVLVYNGSKYNLTDVIVVTSGKIFSMNNSEVMIRDSKGEIAIPLGDIGPGNDKSRKIMVGNSVNSFDSSFRIEFKDGDGQLWSKELGEEPKKINAGATRQIEAIYDIKPVNPSDSSN